MSKYLMLFGAVFLVSCGGPGEKKGVENLAAEEEEATGEMRAAEMQISFNDSLSRKVFQNYLELKEALVETNDIAVDTAANRLAELAAKKPAIKKLALEILKHHELEKQRSLFANLTREIEPILKEQLAEGHIYKQYCPMAFNNEGGFWFSHSKEIRNPYFGHSMLSCGMIKEIL